MPTSLDRLKELWGKLEAFSRRVDGRYPGAMRCAAGCHGCCQRRLTITAIEARAIEEAVGAMPPEARAALAARARAPGEGACAALHADGTCGIYAARPVVCRSHGLPLRLREAGSEALATCELNFTGRPLGELDADCVLDQVTVSTVLLALDAAHTDEEGAARGERHDLGTLLGRMT